MCWVQVPLGIERESFVNLNLLHRLYLSFKGDLGGPVETPLPFHYVFCILLM